MSSESTGVHELIQKILSVFKGRDLGDLCWALGSEILRDRVAKTITICQSRKVIDLLEKFGMSNCKSKTTPLVPRQRL